VRTPSDRIVRKLTKAWNDGPEWAGLLYGAAIIALMGALLILLLPRIPQPCAFPEFNPALRGKTYLCPPHGADQVYEG
jgi:hypothetical protein